MQYLRTIIIVLVAGQITAINGTTFTLKTCEGEVTVDAGPAVAAHQAFEPSIGKHVVVNGERQGDRMVATSMYNKMMACR